MSNKLKKEIFRRGVRMTQKFDQLVNDDPLQADQAFDAGFPVMGQRRSRPLEIGKDGQHRFDASLSPVVKPNGERASINGPAPDYADNVAMPIPASTKKRTPFKPT